MRAQKAEDVRSTHSENSNADATASTDSFSSTLSSSSNSASDSSEEDSADDTEASRPTSTQTAQQQPSLRDRLKSFLPQLEQANESIGQNNTTADGRFELRHEDFEEEDEGYSSEAEEGSYIEMNLGLGVLEQLQAGKRNDDISLPRSGDGEIEESTKRKAEIADRDEGEGDGLSGLTAIGSRQDKQHSNGKRAKRSKIEVVEGAEDGT